MLFYSAGNFVLMSSVEKEKEFKKLALKNHDEYNRLTSFFFKKETEKILQVKKEENT